MGEGGASMRPDLDLIEQRIQQAVAAVDDRWEQVGDSDTAWTRALIDAIGTVGRESGYLVCAAGCKYADDGEWLYDMIRLKVERDMFLDISLALESDWNPDQELLFDFQKLLVSRARHRVMLFWQGTDAAAESRIEQFIDQVKRFESSSSGDRYLFGYYYGER